MNEFDYVALLFVALPPLVGALIGLCVLQQRDRTVPLQRAEPTLSRNTAHHDYIKEPTL